MAQFAAKVLAVLVVGGAVAHAGGRHESWKAVEKLAPGIKVVVEQPQGPPENCRVVAVDDKALTCERDPDPDVDWGPGAKARVVFPRNAVRMVWAWEPVPQRHAGLWIAGAIGFALGARVCAAGGPGSIVGCGAIGALFAVAIALSAEMGPAPYPRVWWPMPPPAPRSYPARQQEWRQKVWYRAPATQSTP